jgi:hypothetical protein
VPHAERYKAALKKEADKKALLTTDPEQASSGTQEGVSVQVGNQLQDRPDDSYTEVPADKVMFRPASLYGPDGLDQPEVEDLARRRLIDQTKRQSSSSWVVLDRATVLSCLKRKPEGMTMVEVAFDLLGAAASPRDTRRLSALMKREEDRKTVTVAGRNKPITLTPAGRAALELIDVKQTNLTAIERRQKRVQAQQQRLIGEAQKVMYENGKKAKNEQIKREKAVLKTKKQAFDTPSLDPGVLVKDGVVVVSTRKAPPANAAATPKKTRKSKSAPNGNTESD